MEEKRDKTQRKVESCQKYDKFKMKKQTGVKKKKTNGHVNYVDTAENFGFLPDSLSAAPIADCATGRCCHTFPIWNCPRRHEN